MFKKPIVAVLLTAFLVLSCKTEKAIKTEKQPNVIIILSDDQGWGDLSLTGNPLLNTPHIDSLAKNGAVLEQFYVGPVCSPTRAEILTGRYAVRGGVYSTSEGGERLDLDETTIADIFKENGYKTAAYGKWHNGMQYPYHPNARGFDDFYGFCSGHWGNYFSPMLEHNGKIVKGNGFLPDDITNHALSFIEKNKDQPFLLYLPFNTPHSPMQVPDAWWEKFENKEINLEHSNKNKENNNHTRAVYALCENIDWNVGRIQDKLKSLQLEENTIIIYFSDNGPNGWRWNGGMKGKKGSVDEGGVRSPFIMQWKNKIQPNTKINNIAFAADLLPTLADLAGITPETTKPFDGISLKPLLFNKEANSDDRYIVNYWDKKISVRNQKFRLDNQNKLFDITNDPGQITDVSLKHPEVLQKMITYKNNWVTNVLSELPEKDTRTFGIAHPDFKYTQLPARDATPYGTIKRSNKWPNCSFFTNWTSVNDSITWDVEVLQSGKQEAVLYYTCKQENVGATIALSYEGETITKKIEKANDPPLYGFEMDRVKREESYVKDFIPLNMGEINLKKGKGTLTLKAVDIKGDAVIDFRLIMLNRVSQ